MSLTNNIASHLGTLDYGDSLGRSRQEERHLGKSKHDVTDWCNRYDR